MIILKKANECSACIKMGMWQIPAWWGIEWSHLLEPAPLPSPATPP